MGRPDCGCFSYVLNSASDFEVRRRTGHHPECTEAKLRLKLSPELGDGVSFTIVDSITDAAERLEDFLCEGAVGTKATIESVLMNDEEVAALESA